MLAGVCNVDAKNSTKATGLSLRPVDRRGDPCRVYYTFIVGTDGTAETSAAIRQESEAYNDVTVLKLAIDPAPHERGNNTVLKSKVKLMFGYVVHNFQWATHYMKGDIDTYPLFNILMYVCVLYAHTTTHRCVGPFHPIYTLLSMRAAPYHASCCLDARKRC